MSGLIALTVLAYVAGLVVQRRTGSALLNPTLLGVVLLIPLLLLLRVPYAGYLDEVEALTAFLAPAVVALAVPVYRQRQLLARQWRAVLGGVAGGAVTVMLLATLAGQLLGLTRGVRLSLITASATSPVALAVAERLDGAPPLAATLAILAGLVGASLLPGWLNRLGVRSALARGVATGSVAHGIGTARIREEGELAGAASSLGMGLGAVLVALLAGLLVGNG